MRSALKKAPKGEDEEKKTPALKRSRLRTRTATSTTTATPLLSRRAETGKKLSSTERGNRSVGPTPPLNKKLPVNRLGNKSVGPTPPANKKPPMGGNRESSVGPTGTSMLNKPPVARTSLTKKETTKKKTVPSKPLCQRSQQRHDAFRASMQKMSLEDSCSVEQKPTTKKQVRPRAGSVVGGSVPPHLPSVRATQTPVAGRPPRRRWFPDSPPEPTMRPSSVRERTLQNKLREQIAGSSLKLSPGVRMMSRSPAPFSSMSPTVRSAKQSKPKREMHKSRAKSEAIYHGPTPPPAEADADSACVMLEDDRWGTRHRYRHRETEKTHFRLKSQEYQYQRLHQHDADPYEVDSPMAIYERVEDEDFELA